jgi:hypothetical protein
MKKSIHGVVCCLLRNKTRNEQKKTLLGRAMAMQSELICFATDMKMNLHYCISLY